MMPKQWLMSACFMGWYGLVWCGMGWNGIAYFVFGFDVASFSDAVFYGEMGEIAETFDFGELPNASS